MQPAGWNDTLTMCIDYWPKCGLMLKIANGWMAMTAEQCWCEPRKLETMSYVRPGKREGD
jgi:hypothetical protein